MRYLCIVSLTGCRSDEIIRIGDTPTHIAVERWQRQCREAGYSDACKYVISEGDAIDAMIALSRLSK